MTLEELTAAFDELTPSDKFAFFKTVMPALCEALREDPQRMMAEMMPLCREMMQGCGIDPQTMMSMMMKMNKGSQ